MIVEWWIVKDLVGSGRHLADVLSRLFLEDTGKPRKISVRIATVSAEIRTKHFLNTVIDQYRYVNPLDYITYMPYEFIPIIQYERGLVNDLYILVRWKLKKESEN
jgi:hypothetical protein